MHLLLVPSDELAPLETGAVVTITLNTIPALDWHMGSSTPVCLTCPKQAGRSALKCTTYLDVPSPIPFLCLHHTYCLAQSSSLARHQRIVRLEACFSLALYSITGTSRSSSSSHPTAHFNQADYQSFCAASF